MTERINYLFLAHSKLRPCSFGPEILVGDLPASVEGTSRIRRDGAVIWEKPFLSGEANMSHAFANLEHHHFKYALFRQPGDVHVHMFGTATLSFADGIKPQAGDVFEIEAAPFGLPLRNPLAIAGRHGRRPRPPALGEPRCPSPPPPGPASCARRSGSAAPPRTRSTIAAG